MTREEFRAKWSARRTEWEKLGVFLSAAKVCEEFIGDFENVLTSQDEAVLNTNEAAVMTGYSRERLLGLFRQGKLRGHRKGKSVFFRAGDLPKKPMGARQAIPSSSAAPPADQETRANARRLAERLGVRNYSCRVGFVVLPLRIPSARAGFFSQYEGCLTSNPSYAPAL